MTPGSQKPFLKTFAQALKRDSVTKINVDSYSTKKGYILHFCKKSSSIKFFDSPQYDTPGSQLFKLLNLNYSAEPIVQWPRQFRIMKKKNKTGGRKSRGTIPLSTEYKLSFTVLQHFNSLL